MLQLAEPLSPTARVLLQRIEGSLPGATLQQLAKDGELSPKLTRETVDELVIRGCLRVTADGRLLPVRDDDPALDSQAPLTRAALQLASQEHWRFLRSLDAGGLRQDEEDGVPVYGGQGARAVLGALQLAGPKELLSMSPAPVFRTLRKSDLPVRQANEAMLAAGATDAVWVTDEQRLQVPALRAHVQLLAGLGEQVLSAPAVTQRMAIYDRQVAIVPMDPHHHLNGCLVIRSRTVIDGLVSLFHEVKRRSVPFAAAPTISLSRRAILVELAAGAKDEAIARRLNVSARSIRRAVSSLMADCGAESRFQLAVAAVRLGWLTEDDLVGAVRPGD